MISELVIPDILPHLVAILSLLVIWQYYQMQVMAGRILAIDIFDRSGIRMYVCAMPDDESICEVCRDAHGLVFLPSQVAKKHFTPLRSSCTGTVPCPSVLVGLYGAWVEARGVVERLRAGRQKEAVQLSAKELRGVVNGQWERSISAETDRLGVHMLEALCYEHINPDVSIPSYRYVIDQVKEVRHLLLLVPAYLRLTQLLIRHGRSPEALEMVERFETRFPPVKRGPHFPTPQQRHLMTNQKSKLLKTLPPRVPGETSPPSASVPQEGHKSELAFRLQQ